MRFEMNKLRGRIREKLYSERSLAEAINICQATMSTKLNGRAHFAQKDIALISKLLEIPKEEIGEYFFTEVEE